MLGFVCIITAVGHYRSTPQSEQRATTSSKKDRYMDLSSWKYVPGARVASDGILITPQDLKIVNQDGSGGQPNPAINSGGQFIAYSDEVSISATMTAAAQHAEQSLRLYSQPPGIYDEWRWEPPSLDIVLRGNELTLKNYDGTKETPDTTKYPITQASLYQLEIKKNRTMIDVYLNNNRVTSVDGRSLCATKKIWFGASAASPWKLIAISIPNTSTARFQDSLPSPKIQSSSQSLGTLMATKNKKFGTAISLNPLIADVEYQKLALTEFSQFTPENELKAQFVHPAPHSYEFGPSDLLVNIAEHHAISIHGHALVFGEANPAWMQSAKPELREQIMVDHITSIMKHYKKSILEWDVINEPLSDNDADYADGGNGLRHHIWYQAMGESYIAKALRAARLANPQAKLYINDYGLEADGDRWEAMISLIARLQADNVPLDGIGFQSHVYQPADHQEYAVSARHMKQLESLGLSTRMSEIDVHGEDQTVQAQQYTFALQACLVSVNCTSYSMWGMSDAHGSTTSDHTYPLEYGDDLPWDEAYKPKLAVAKIREMLQAKNR